MTEIMNLNEKWDNFIDYVDENEDMDSKDLKKYKQLMVETFKIIKKEWEQEKVSKELCLFFATFGRFGKQGWDNDGNCLCDGYYEATSIFHSFFIENMIKNNGFKFDKEGKIIIEDDVTFYIDSEKFDFPTDVDELLGL